MISKLVRCAFLVTYGSWFRGVDMSLDVVSFLSSPTSSVAEGNYHKLSCFHLTVIIL